MTGQGTSMADALKQHDRKNSSHHCAPFGLCQQGRSEANLRAGPSRLTHLPSMRTQQALFFVTKAHLHCL